MIDGFMSIELDNLKKELLFLNEDLEFPPVSVPEPSVEHYPEKQLDDGNGNGDFKLDDLTEAEKTRYQELAIIINNYISSIKGIVDDIDSKGISENSLSQLLGLLNAFEDAINKWVTENLDKLSEEEKPLVLGQYWAAKDAIKQFREWLAPIFIDTEINDQDNIDTNKEEATEYVKEKGIETKESVDSIIYNFQKGKISFKPKNLSDKANKRVVNLVKKIQKNADDQKFKLGRTLLQLEVTQKAIQAAAYLNPLTAVAYELYKNVYKPLKQVSKQKSKATEKEWKDLKGKLEPYIKQKNITPKDLDKYIGERKKLKNFIDSREYKIGNTDSFLFERFQKVNKISLEDLETYLGMMYQEEYGEEESKLTEQMISSLDSFRAKNKIKIESIAGYLEARQQVNRELLTDETRKIGTITVAKFQKLLLDKDISFNNLVDYYELRKDNDEVLSLDIVDKLKDYKSENKITDRDIEKYIKAREVNDGEPISDTNSNLKIGKTSVKDFEQFLLEADIDDIKYLMDLNNGEEAVNETLERCRRFPLKAILGKSRAEFKNTQEIIDAIHSNTDYVVAWDDEDCIEVAHFSDLKRPHDYIMLNECMLQDIQEIGNGIIVFMPSGFQAELSISEDGNIIVSYGLHNDVYSEDEFGTIIDDGVIVFNDPSQLIMESVLTKDMKRKLPARKLNSLPNIHKLDKIQKRTPTGEPVKQAAITLMNASGLGIDASQEANELEKEFKNLEESKNINEISDELVRKVSDKRFSDFVNSEEEDMEKACKKLRKNIKLNNNRKKEQMSEISKAIAELKEAMYGSNISEEDMNEISDDLAKEVHSKRFQNMDAAKQIEKSKFNKFANARKRFDAMDRSKNDLEDMEKAIEDKDQAEKEWKEADNELTSAVKKLDKNTGLYLDREFRKHESVNEDIGGLTDVADLDLPTALADTIEVTDEGKVLTLDSLYAEIKSLKSELNSAVQSIKDSIASQIQNISSEMEAAKQEEEIEELEAKVDELESEMVEEPQEMNDENSVEEVDSEEDLEESLMEKLLKPGALTGMKERKMKEDLNAVKSEIDKAHSAGKSAEEIKAVIDLNAENDDEKKQAKDYAAAKITEEVKVSDLISKLHQTRSNSAINNTKYSR